MPDRAPTTLAVGFPTATPHTLTGRVELALADALRLPTRPERASGVLDALFSSIGGLPVTRNLVDRLATGARAWCLTRAALTFLPGLRWFQASCTSCGEVYDLSVSLADTPRSDIPVAFPVIEVDTSLGPRRFEVPNGATERALADAAPTDAPRVLAASCGLDSEASAQAALFNPSDLALIDTQLDAATPDIPDTLTSTCPTCEAETSARIDPLSFAFPNAAALVQQIHALATAYHWSEDAILDMPSSRRRAYAKLIAEGGSR
ncbi:hypothetical protein BCF46_0072 [Litoreibacter meonggei]|uniref:T4 bacteriophage base plate protein n=1 Tax=Litoreibacter meonggei TaxID=1049199 RepID=A0A497X1Z7_9RHOB|nr:hypothetical protein [Litoreibacter meonggei]RLJ59882.1 hypothetical protein BCF46_0072 [Litoreibacter meonggei]